MKTPLALVLALSLAGNALLAFFVLRPATGLVNPAPAPLAAGAPRAASPATSPSPRPVPVATPVGWTTLQSGQNLHGLVANLRAAGFPTSVIRAVVAQLVTDQLDHAAIDHLPFWKQNGNNPEYVAAQLERSNRRQEMLTDLLGADASPSAGLDPSDRARRYGSLPDDKIDRIEAVNRDYNELRSKLYAQRKSGDVQSTMSAQAAVDAEKHAELATFLAPAELEQYEMRNSTAASRLATSVKDITVTEQEYTELFRAQKAFESADPARTGTFNADTLAQRNAAQAVLNEEARAVLADDRFYDYLKGSDTNYARVAQFTTNYPEITPATTYALMTLERDFQASAIAMARGANGGNMLDRAAQFTSARREYQDKVNALIGEAAGTAFMQRNRLGTTAARPGGN